MMITFRRAARLRVTVLAFALLLVPACGGDDEPSPSAGSGAVSATTGRPNGPADGASASAWTVTRPDGPAADLDEELTGGRGVFLPDAIAGTGGVPDGFVETERVAAGTAVAYLPAGPDALPTDGRFELVEGESADYRTRVVVRHPADPADFNGTVIVEWLNVSGGIDANPDYAFLADEIARGGYAWVGVSAQSIGVEGGPVAVGVSAGGDFAGKGLKGIDPGRYGSLAHPGDAYSYDIVTQVARALRAGDALDGLEPARVVAVGESQSAFALTTYANGVQPRTGAFDGILLHSRGGAAAPLGEGGGPIDIASAITGAPTIVRTDTEVPVMIVVTETDLTSVLAYAPARQDDTDRVRTWEIAGTAHADRFLVGAAADGIDCGVPINDGPQRFVLPAALRSFDVWVRSGEAPPSAERIELEEGPAGWVVVRDDDGIALGGIRTPLVDVPVDVHSGEPGPTPSVICLLLGSSTPLPEERIVALHGTRSDYEAGYESSTDQVVAEGFVLPEDREDLLDAAQPDRVPG